MKHKQLNDGMLKAYLDNELDSIGASDRQELIDHIEGCDDCRAELKTLADRSANLSGVFEALPELTYPANANATATAWAAFQRKRDQSDETRLSRLSPWTKWTLAGGGFAAVSVAVLLTLAPVRAWAESLLSVFRVEHFTVLELNQNLPNGLQNNQLVNQSITRLLSDEVTVTQQPQKPQLVADAATASRLAGFPVKLLVGWTPAALWVETGFGAQMKLDRDRLQAILDEAGRDDLRIPSSVDGAIIGVRIPAGVMARYGDCGDAGTMKDQGGNAIAVHSAAGSADSACTTLTQLPSPIVSAPKDLDPGQIAQVGLQFFGMTPNDAASFTQTVDWTSTLVLPVVGGQSSYRQVHVNGNEGVLLRPKFAPPVSKFTLMWVEDGIVYMLNGNGDDVTATNLAEQLE
jgi:hypothetical protein